MSIGIRLKEERERIGLSQDGFAALGGASKRSQIDWEKGVAAPNATFLAAVAEHGVDVRYVVTGVHESGALPPDEQRLLALYRLADAAVRKAVIGALATGEPPTAPPMPSPQPKRIRRAGTEVVIHGGVSQHIEGGSHPGATFHVDMRSGTTKK